jgi:REP element-mobilizing transposase RayT
MKYHPNGRVLFVTFTVEEGLVLLCNPLCRAIIESCLAAAQELYPVNISHLLVEATHVHLVLTVYNPEHVPAFMRHFKTESAHMINSRLLQYQSLSTPEKLSMNSPRTTPLNQRLMTSKFRFLHDGTGGVSLISRFSLRSSRFWPVNATHCIPSEIP